jgi:hypothetical protein
MTITLELTQEAIESLSAQADARGLSLEAFLHTIITTQTATMTDAAALGPVQAVQPIAGEGQDTDKAIDDLFDLVAVAPEVGEGAAKRGNWYR